MASSSLGVSEYDAIAQTMQRYIDGGRSGRASMMRPSFHDDASIFGYADGTIFAGQIQKLFDFVDGGAPAAQLEARIVSVDVFDTIAVARLELDDWNGHRYTDVFTLLKVGGEWKIMIKAFHQHS